ncbi:unnamed protein product [Brachionus calyciflorus]|uniref:Uncharacterized protein n=1 Tax=Brachionus calyciflorus TaxID=104777 RepID=A0A814FDP0_9BILA|nr:unnamed protein product [Brachionus calyciflorus]
MVGSDVIEKTGKHFHDVLSDAKIKAKIAEQELKKEQINEEVLRLWNLKEATGKRKRISKLDREEAHKSIVKKFRLEETNNMHLEYLQRHGSDLNN